MVRVGQTLCGKLRVEALIGQGGMASVWRGTHLSTGRRIAIKVLDDRFLGNDRVVERFGREARAASAIHHDSIVDVIDLDRTEAGEPFLVMEFVEGETLSQRIERQGRLSEGEIVLIADPLLDALHAAHEAGVVHRDLKPDNIMLVHGGRRGDSVKVLDFGISSKADELSNLTSTGSLLGTPHYMSPEQAKGRTDVDRRADVYAIGVLLYECAVGDVPFDAENYNALIQEILNSAPVPPRARGAMISEAVEALILEAMNKDRSQRPATAEALRERLLAIAELPASAATSGSHPAVAVDARTSKRAEAEGRKLAMTVDAPPAAKPAEPAPASRGSQDRLATLDIEIPSKAEAPAPPRPSNASPLSALPSTPPPSNGKKLELDVHALRRHRRSSDPSRAPRTSDEPPLAARRWLRVAIASACAAIVLVLFVRFVVHPSGVLQAAAHALRSAASP